MPAPASRRKFNRYRLHKTRFFKAECDFTNKKDVADFFYSLDGKTSNALGTTLKMTYTLPHFMGYRFALFNYAIKTTGGAANVLRLPPIFLGH